MYPGRVNARVLWLQSVSFYITLQNEGLKFIVYYR